ncbi:nickel-responsive transcriptional regulator NikR [Methylobacillus flagellatus]|uniref:Putative nickel-responsive regulator n=1 Tax=Methylobacillus flagellatus (strain ATCC 51484 / DSM 6875 / VKM B-1610 / KT) TaxID=265072 RepID=Q1H065_METFK|nr:nickel-responsive transcriptional regulator NikR [Methylobacillus flagellatus]ABE50122.1 transcriptional regulator, CopG family [Methylobacillus flagellatus KT]
MEAQKKRSRPVNRISISLPDELHAELDIMVAERGFESRSQAINDMLRQYLAEHQREKGNEVMVGTITLLYNNATRGLQKTIADLQYQHVDEVISSLHVHLTDNQTMEVILVQGPAQDVQKIADELIALRGVTTGRLQLMAAMIPPLHPMPSKGRKA